MLRRYLYVTEKHGVRRVDLKTGKVDALTGARGSQRYRNGPFTEARFKDPRHLVLGPDQTLFVADCFNYRIRAVQLANEEVRSCQCSRFSVDVATSFRSLDNRERYNTS